MKQRKDVSTGMRRFIESGVHKLAGQAGAACFGSGIHSPDGSYVLRLCALHSCDGDHADKRVGIRKPTEYRVVGNPV